MANTQNLDLVKPLGTDHALVSVLNSNSDKIDAYAGAVNAGLDGLRDGLGILADGNTHAEITSGQFVYVKNHQTLPQGLYQATTNIAANGTLSTSNLTADPNGGLNTLSEQIGTINTRLYGASFQIETTSGSAADLEFNAGNNRAYLLMSLYRDTGVGANKDGFAIIKIYDGVAYVAYKQQCDGITTVSYNASTHILTVHAGAYLNIFLWG